MKALVADKESVAYCGLYCGACKKFLAETCHGCHENSKATWCKIRSCNMEHGYASCADCTTFTNPKDCKKFNNFISKIFALLFKSDRAACIACIKESGYEGYARFMAKQGLQSIKRT